MTPTEKKQQKLFELLRACGYTDINAAARVDSLVKYEISCLSDYDWWMNYFKDIYGDFLKSRGYKFI